MPEQQQTRETRTPANLSTKYDPELGEANAKRFQAGVTALLKTSDNKGELALAILEGRADSSKKCLVQFEPRALDYKKVCEILKTTGDEAKALQAGKTEARAEKDAKDDEHIAYMMQVLDIKQKLFALLPYLCAGLWCKLGQLNFNFSLFLAAVSDPCRGPDLGLTSHLSKQSNNQIYPGVVTARGQRHLREAYSRSAPQGLWQGMDP